MLPRQNSIEKEHLNKLNTQQQKDTSKNKREEKDEEIKHDKEIQHVEALNKKKGK